MYCISLKLRFFGLFSFSLYYFSDKLILFYLFAISLSVGPSVYDPISVVAKVGEAIPNFLI